MLHSQMSKPIKRGGRYYVRRRVPLDLIDHFHRKEFVQALGTSDRTVAVMLCHSADAAYDARFIEARRQIAERSRPRDSGAWSGMAQEEWGPEDGSLAEEEEERLCERVAASVAASVRQTLLSLGFAPGEAPRPRYVPPVVTAPASRLVQPARTPAKVTAEVQEKTWTAITRLWEKARKPQSRTVDAMWRTVNRFKEHMGDIPIPVTTKADIVAFRDKMVVANHGTTSVAAALSHMHNLGNFAVGRAWIDMNPVAGVKVEQKRKGKGTKKAARPPFDVPTLNRIFANRVYTEGARPHPDCAGDAAYWLPLLGLFTGARIEELCQLAPDDVYEEEYRDGRGKEHTCWVVRIIDNEEAGQGVKNAYSYRRLPVHDVLIKQGFIEYVQGKKGGTRIFPGLRPDGHGIESSNWSKWWLKHIRKECAPTSPKMVFHSFRHLFKDVCRDCGISKEHADALQGHSDGESSDDYGGEFFPLRPLMGALSKYKIHGLKLPPKP